MDAKMLEGIDKRRYKLLLLQTICFAFFFGSIIVSPYVGNDTALSVVTSFGFLWTALFLLVTVRLNRLNREINMNKSLKMALNNEMHKALGYKSITLAFYSTLVVIFAFSIAVRYVDIPTVLVCYISGYVAILTLKIAVLVYNRG